MRVRIEPSRAKGSILAPPSKSMAHRMLICAGLAGGESRIEGVDYSKDVLATISCLTALGASVRTEGDVVFVRGADVRKAPRSLLPCNESGSTLRFFLPLCLLSEEEKKLTGAPRLMERPQGIYREMCDERGIRFEQTGESITVAGKLRSGEYLVDGSVSSQFISGLLFALPLLDGDSVIRIERRPESRPYIELTRAALTASGVKTAWQGDNVILVPGNQKYQPIFGRVEGDYSNAAFFEALNLLGGKVTVEGLCADSGQGDAIYRKYFSYLKEGAPTAMDLSDCPDLAPVLFAVAAARGGGEFIGTERLKWKECDRGAAMKKELSAFGGVLIDHGDRITVEKTAMHAPSRVLSGHNDHRIVMALSILLTVYGGEIEGAEAVSKSLPDFFERLSGLGVKVKQYVS